VRPSRQHRRRSTEIRLGGRARRRTACASRPRSRARERIAECRPRAAIACRAAEAEAEELLREARSPAEHARNEAVSSVGADSRRRRGERGPTARRGGICGATAQREAEAEREPARGEAESERARGAIKASRLSPPASSSRACASSTPAQSEASLSDHGLSGADSRRSRDRRAGCSPRPAARLFATLASVGDDLASCVPTALEHANEVRAKARDAREIVGESHVVALEVMRE